MTLDTAPVAPWHWVILALAAAGALAAAWLALSRHVDMARTPRVIALALTLFTAALLALAGWNPGVSRTPRQAQHHLALALDVSDSVLRAAGGWPAVQRDLAEQMEGWTTGPATRRADGSAGIVTFGAGTPVSAIRKLAAAGLAEAVRRLDRSDFAAGSASDLAGGLRSAGQQIRAAGGTGAVLLVSDGNETVGDARAAARELARQGIPIHVWPVAGQAPGTGIVAANLPARVTAGEETFLRLVLHNGSDQPARITLRVQPNAGEDLLAAMQPQEIAPGEWRSARVPLRFSGRGLQFVDIVLAVEDTAATQARRFYTQVIEPARLLAVGGDLGWLAALPPEMASITVAGPADLNGATPLADYDGLLISGTPASQFSDAALAAVRRAVEEDGLGLFVVNGAHTGDEQAVSVLGSYAGTSLENLLPVSGRPRDFSKEPPGRKIVVLVDTSGSMDGVKLELAKEVIRRVAGDLMREVDRLDLMTFTVDAARLVQSRNMDASGKAEMLAAVDGMAAGGGTDPTLALEQLATLDLSGDCGLIFISDGEFAPVTTRPECRATVFAIGWESVPPDSPLYAFADPVPVAPGFDPGDITVPYFEPEKRKRFWEPHTFMMLSPGRTTAVTPLPDLPLDGAAVTYLREDAELAAVRPRFADPVLAYREAEAGYVGAFTGEIPVDWAAHPTAAKAVTAWVERILPFQAFDRYNIRVDDNGAQMLLRVMVAGDGSQIPQVDGLDAHVEVQDVGVTAAALRADPQERATFAGIARIPRTDSVRRGYLVLREQGPDRLPRPQRLPIMLPPQGDMAAVGTAESYTYGLDEALLRDLAAAGGGQYAPPANAPLFQARPPDRQRIALWPWLATAALAAYVGAVAVQRWAT